MPEWLKLCISKSVVRRALATVVVVGVILVAINYGDSIVHGQITLTHTFRIIFTFCVPYCVSTYSSVTAILEMRHTEARQKLPDNTLC